MRFSCRVIIFSDACHEAKRRIGVDTAHYAGSFAYLTRIRGSRYQPRRRLVWCFGHLLIYRSEREGRAQVQYVTPGANVNKCTHEQASPISISPTISIITVRRTDHLNSTERADKKKKKKRKKRGRGGRKYKRI